jgi:anti-sigma B factor antagonist
MRANEERAAMKYSTQREAGSTVLHIEGECDALTAPELRSFIDALVAESPTKVVVDLGSLRVIDSSGVGAIVSLYKRLRALGGDFEVRGLNGQPLAIFKVLNLDRVFHLAS